MDSVRISESEFRDRSLAVQGAFDVACEVFRMDEPDRYDWESYISVRDRVTPLLREAESAWKVIGDTVRDHHAGPRKRSAHAEAVMVARSVAACIEAASECPPLWDSVARESLGRIKVPEGCDKLLESIQQERANVLRAIRDDPSNRTVAEPKKRGGKRAEIPQCKPTGSYTEGYIEGGMSDMRRIARQFCGEKEHGQGNRKCWCGTDDKLRKRNALPDDRFQFWQTNKSQRQYRCHFMNDKLLQDVRTAMNQSGTESVSN